MRVFVAGATGVIGVRIVPMLVAEGDVVAGLTRSQPDVVASLGAEPVVCDAYDAAGLKDAMRAFAPDFVMHELTDLPDHLEELDEKLPENRRMRLDGTRNLVAASDGACIVMQSVAFPAGAEQAEQMVLDAGGVVVRLGYLYGPGTWYAKAPDAPEPRTHVDVAARAMVDAIYAPARSVVEIVDDGASA
ncbi:MAG: NAD(P)-dependent oxidoreductase [Actinobacteria bacterium]|nr:NAD(P)-dependent oxidoreductase [Actinomycetota bacterium]MBV8479503.1 NAD(P)-dependent oxidoreductase [Actinomycetota bacterium]MBV8598323.1 NAD(P)-dependent oxidoreductase [Actinomycetota bacterium]